MVSRSWSWTARIRTDKYLPLSLCLLRFQHIILIFIKNKITIINNDIIYSRLHVDNDHLHGIRYAFKTFCANACALTTSLESAMRNQTYHFTFYSCQYKISAIRYPRILYYTNLWITPPCSEKVLFWFGSFRQGCWNSKWMGIFKYRPQPITDKVKRAVRKCRASCFCFLSSATWKKSVENPAKLRNHESK